MNDESFITWIVVLRFTFQLGLTLHGFTSMHHKFILFFSFFFLRLRISRESYIYLSLEGNTYCTFTGESLENLVWIGGCFIVLVCSQCLAPGFLGTTFWLILPNLWVAVGIIRPFCCLNSADRYQI